VECRGELYRIAVPEHMHVHRERLVAQQVIVQCRHLDAAGRELCDDRVDLGLGQHEIAHHHALLAHFRQGQPPAERKAGFQLDAVKCDFQICARQTDAIDATRRRRAGLSKHLADARLPAVIGSKGEAGHSGKKNREP
jgi:hypothetical protein